MSRPRPVGVSRQPRLRARPHPAGRVGHLIPFMPVTKDTFGQGDGHEKLGAQ